MAFASRARSRLLPLAVGLLAVATSTAAGAADDGAAQLAEAKAAALALTKLKATIHVVDTAEDGTVGEREITCWIDVKAGRARTEVRTVKKALPHLIVCGGPDAVRFECVEVEEVAEQSGRFDLPTLLAVSFAGELLATTFRGDLAAMKAAAYGKPVLVGADGTVAGEPCVRLHFSGNKEADLWIGARDHLPRRIKGTASGHLLDETVVELATTFAAEDAELELKLVDGVRPLDASTALARWRTLPAESTRWLAPEEAAPDFAALDLSGQLHLLSETAEEEAVLAFWNSEDDESVAKAAEVERAFADHGDPAIHFLHVAALARREPVLAAAARHRLVQPVWVAGTHAKNAFRLFQIWTAPVFVRLDDRTVVAITRDPAEARGWFKKK